MRGWFAVVMLVACGKSGSTNHDGDKLTTFDAEAAAIEAFITHVSTAIDGAGRDCTKLDAAFAGFAQQAGALSSRFEKVSAPPLTASERGVQLKAQMDAWAPKLTDCLTRANVAALFEAPGWIAIRHQVEAWVDGVQAGPLADAALPADAAVPSDAAVLRDAGVPAMIDAGTEPAGITPKPEWGFVIAAEHEPSLIQKKLDTAFGPKTPVTTYVGFQGSGAAGALQVWVYELPAKWRKQKSKAVFAALEADLKQDKAKLDGNDVKLGKEVGRDVRITAAKVDPKNGKTIAHERWLFRGGKLFVARAVWAEKVKGAAAFAKQGDAFLESFGLP